MELGQLKNNISYHAPAFPFWRMANKIPL